MDQLAPGPAYILRLLPKFLVPSAIVYASLTLGRRHFDINIPSWIVAVLTIFARPVLFFVQRYYNRWANERAAAALGAVMPPNIQDSPFSIMNKAVACLQTGYPLDVFGEWANERGNTYQIDLLADNAVVTLEPEHIKAILATQFDSFDKGPIFRGQLDALLGSGVFNVDGEMWKFHRAMTRPFFTRERISDFEIYDRNCDLVLEETQNRLAAGYPVDFQDLVGRFTLDSATEFLFGHNVGSLSAGIPYPPMSAQKNSPSFYNHPSNIFTDAFTEGQVRAALRTNIGGDWPLFEFSKDTVKPLRKVMDDFTTPLMEEALAARERKLAEESYLKDNEEETLLAHLVNHTQDRKILKDELVNLLVAGRDTTMCLLTFSMYMLSEHPDVEQRLREEILDKVGPGGKPSYENMRELKYVRAFLNEVLRLYPSVPGDNRTSNKAVVLPAAKGSGQTPIYIPANTACIYTVINMHRRTDLWGPDALKFDPDRFLDERVHKYLTPNPFIFCPFNAGPRICLGQQFAYHEATYFLVRLLQQFTGFTLDTTSNVKPPADWAGCAGLKGTEKVHPMAHLTMYVKGGLWVKMKELKVSDI